MAITQDDRTEVMVRNYGEACTKAAAARILGRHVRTVGKMLNDGRLDYACAGTMVDVRSIARYISQPKQEDFAAKKRRIQLKYNSEFAV